MTLRGQKEQVHAEQRVITRNTYLNQEEGNRGMETGAGGDKGYFVNAITTLMAGRILTWC